MKAMAKGVEFPRAYQTVAAEVRSWIGVDLHPGDLLPSERSLAERFSVQRATVRRALDTIVQAGLVRRHSGRGFLVVDRNATGEFAVVVWPHELRPDASPYFSMVCAATAQAIRARNSRWAVKLHMGHAQEEGEGADPLATLDLLEPDVLKRLRGVFSFHLGLVNMEHELEAAGVPLVSFGGPSKCPAVRFDNRFFYAAALARLRQVGCRTLGTIRWGSPPEFEPTFSDELRANHLATRPEWDASYYEDWTAVHAEEKGYEMFLRLWDQPNRPDGLLVTDDMLCRGVLRAILHLGIKLPDTLRLITYANRGIAFPYHLPVTRVEFDPEEQARHAVEMMVFLVSGWRLPSRDVQLPGTLVQGATA
jgi:DNA-binding LacI/PurR family transcriptional regulator